MGKLTISCDTCNYLLLFAKTKCQLYIKVVYLIAISQVYNINKVEHFLQNIL